MNLSDQIRSRIKAEMIHNSNRPGKVTIAGAFGCTFIISISVSIITLLVPPNIWGSFATINT